MPSSCWCRFGYGPRLSTPVRTDFASRHLGRSSHTPLGHVAFEVSHGHAIDGAPGGTGDSHAQLAPSRGEEWVGRWDLAQAGFEFLAGVQGAQALDVTGLHGLAAARWIGQRIIVVEALRYGPRLPQALEPSAQLADRRRPCRTLIIFHCRLRERGGSINRKER